MNKRIKKTLLIVGIQIIIASLLIIGADWTRRDVNILFHSYFADTFLPFGFYFLLLMVGDKNNLFKVWWRRALVIFALVSVSEILQYFGIYALATIFDPLDFLMYALGILLAVLLNRKVFARYFSFWE